MQQLQRLLYSPGQLKKALLFYGVRRGFQTIHFFYFRNILQALQSRDLLNGKFLF